MAYEISVVGINAAGEIESSYDPEINYTPPPGSIRPSEISLPPGQSLHFRYNDVHIHNDWGVIRYWTINPEFTLTYSSFTEMPPYPCENVAGVAILSDPIPNRP